MTDHRAEAVRLAARIEASDPGRAAIVHALLELSGPSVEPDAVGAKWHRLRTYGDLPTERNRSYLFDYEDGRQIVWHLVVLPSGVFWYIAPDRQDEIRDPNDLVDECRRWRDA